MRGGRRWTTTLKCMWDMFRDLFHLLETPGVSLYYWLNKHDLTLGLPKCETQIKFKKLRRVLLGPCQAVYDSRERTLNQERLATYFLILSGTNFWLYWQTMFAFPRWILRSWDEALSLQILPPYWPVFLALLHCVYQVQPVWRHDFAAG